MQDHKFAVGNTVSLTPSIFMRSQAAGSYRIVRLLPAAGTDNQYRIKSIGDGHERVVTEGQLAAA